MSNVLKNAKDTVSEAIQLDNEGNMKKPIKYEKNDATKKILTSKVEEYMDRAEVLKKAIKDGKSKPAAIGEGGGAGGGSGNAENDKLRGAISEAVVKEKPNVKWDDVAGLHRAKEALKEAVILPVKFPQLFQGERKPWKGILLFGPPGTGKSFLAKAVATEADSTFFSVSSADLVSKWQGESEKLVRSLFVLAREESPAIIFVDEIDSLCGARGEGENEASRRIKTEFLVQMQGVSNKPDGVLVLGATNLPWSLDQAMRRRFEKRIYIPLPDEEARTVMFKLNIGETPNDLKDQDFRKLGRESEGFSGSDLSVVVREALMLPLREFQGAKFFREDNDGFYEPVVDYPPCPYCPMNISTKKSTQGKKCKRCKAVRMNLYQVPSEKIRNPRVTVLHFFDALEGTKPSVGADELVKFVEWTNEFGQEG